MSFFIFLIFVAVIIYMHRMNTTMSKLNQKIDHLTSLVREKRSVGSVDVVESQLSSVRENASQALTSRQEHQAEAPAFDVDPSYDRTEDVATQKAVAQTESTPVRSDGTFVDHTLDTSAANSSPNTTSDNAFAALDSRVNTATYSASEDSLHADRFFAWLKHDWPLKIGGFLIILAAGWFITYAAAEGWLSEAARVTMGYIFGVAALIYGTFRADKVRLQGNIFLLIGIAVIFVSTIAAVNFSSVSMPSALALFVMLLTVAFVSLISLKQESQALTGMMIAFGAFVPLAFFEAGLETHIIFAYLFVLTIGTLWIVYKTSWRRLTALMLGVVAFYSIGHALDVGNAQSWTNMLLALAFGAVFYGANVRAILSSVYAGTEVVDDGTASEGKQLGATDYLTAVGVTMMYLIWVYLFGPEDYRVVLLLLGVVLFVGASYGIHSATRIQTPTIIYGAAAFILIAVATAEVASGAVLITAYIVESSVAIALSIYVRGKTMNSSQQTLCGILFGIPLLMLIDSILKAFAYISAKGSSFSYGRNLSLEDVLPHLFAIFVGLLCSLILALLVRLNLDLATSKNRVFMQYFASVGFVLSVVLVWLVTHTFIATQDVATFVSLFIYTAAGAYFYVLGARSRYKPYQIVGVVLFGIVLLDVFLIEFWEMSQAMRIITAFVVGVVLMVAAFIARSRGDKDTE